MLPGSALAAVAAVAALSGAAAPQDRPEAFERLTACRSITDGPQRLTCYDAAVVALDTAQRQGEVVVVDRAQATEASRRQFGFAMPTLPRLFGAAEGEVDSIETTLQGATELADGSWVFRLADGSVWRQVDRDRASFRNRPGEPVRVRKASMGSFLLTVGNAGALRVRRQGE